MPSALDAVRRAALMPVWAAQLLTGAKSFSDNPLIGSQWLNERGLHTLRTRLAHHIAAVRRRQIEHLIDADDRRDFDRDGYIVKRDFLPTAEFQALRQQAADYRGLARETVQGDTATRRIALSPAVLACIPAAARLLELPRWRGALAYVASTAAEPIHYLQTILTRIRNAPADPQLRLHSDTFHPTMKAWLFLDDGDADAAPFLYVPGSHRLSEARLRFEQETSLAATSADRLTARGSFRVSEDRLPAMDLPPPKRFPAVANTLVIADTCGFHARGPSPRPARRVELWSYSRRTPFWPLATPDLWRLSGLAAYQAPLYWAALDAEERLGLGRNVWRARAATSAFDPYRPIEE